MNTDAMVLRALLRLARRRLPADDQAVVLRVGTEPAAVRDSIRRLDTLGLVERVVEQRTTRLTMAGFTLALALLPAQAAGRVQAGQPHTRRTTRAA